MLVPRRIIKSHSSDIPDIPPNAQLMKRQDLREMQQSTALMNDTLQRPVLKKKNIRGTHAACSVQEGRPPGNQYIVEGGWKKIPLTT